MKVNSFERYENKYIVTKEQAYRIMDKLLPYVNYDEHCKNRKYYTIYNLYFDNENNDVIRHSVSKPVFKEKMRLRSYHQVTNKEMVFLEIKRKIKGKVTKRRVSLTNVEAYNFYKNRIKPLRSTYLEKQIINELDYYLQVNKTKPFIFIGYKRIGMYSKENSSLRITFDFDIIKRDEDLTLENIEGTRYVDSDIYIMEVKVMKSLPLWFVKILSEENLNSQGFSKYGYYYEQKTKKEVLEYV